VARREAALEQHAAQGPLTLSPPAAPGPLHERYLRLLGLAEPPVGVSGLHDLVHRHLCRVPFENVSKLLLFGREGRGRVTTMAEFLDGIEQCDLGGTCYTSNPFLADLLGALGYDAALYAADMDTPNVHTSIRVQLAGRQWHIDVGYAGPFSNPIPLDRLPYETAWGNDRYVFDRHGEGHMMTVFTNGERRHGYVVHAPARAASFFDPVVLQSFEPGRTFMRCLRITRFFEDRAVELRNRRLLRVSAGRVRETSVDSMADLRRAVNEEFQMPRCRIEEAVAVLERLNRREFFGSQVWRDSTD
jgi:N-hydroxyarylamine O-acetyltransferase